MFLLKNAFYNIRRHKVRFIMIGFVIVTILFISSISIILNATTEAIKQDYKNSTGSIAYIVTKDKKKADVPIEQLLKFGKSEFLLKSEYLSSSMYVFTNITPLDQEDDMFLAGNEGESSPHGYLYGSSRSDINNDFKNEKRKIIEGAIFNEKNEVIISKELAKLNNLHVGDKIEIKNTQRSSQQVHTLKITGIYENYEIEKKKNYKTALSNYDNQIFTSLSTMMEMGELFTRGEVEAKFYLKNPNLLESWEKELFSKNLNPDCKVITDTASYQKMITPIEGIHHISNLFVVIILLLGISTLLLFSILAIRERKYEIGILRSLGMKKGKIAINFILENLIITIICLLLGITLALIVGEPTSDYFIQNQMELQESQKEANHTVFNTKVNLKIEDILKIIVISIVITGISSIASIIIITRYEPKKILNEG